MTHAQARLLGRFAATIMRLYLATLRWQAIDRAGVLATPPARPLLWTFWHNRLFVMAGMFRRFFPTWPGAALISASKDGELIATLIEAFHIRAVRGSSSRGGGRALVEMKRILASGSVMAITPDGPRGPCYVVNPGLVKLAQITDGTILPIHVHYSRAWRLGSWDGFMIPWPFAKVTLTFDAVHHVAPTTTDEEFEAERQKVEALLRQPGDV